MFTPPVVRKRMLLIDGSNIAYISRYSKFPKKEDLPENPQAWMELIAERVHWLMKELGGYAFIFVMDGPPYQRAMVYPPYKGERDADTEQGRAQWKQIQHRIKHYFPTAYMENYEADDLIARYCERYGNHPEWEMVICSADKDLVQLLGRWNNVNIWRTYKGEWARIPSYDHLAFLALVGDDGDNISGITGDKTAIKLLEGPRSELDAFLDRPYKLKARDQRAVDAGLLKGDNIPKTNRDVFNRNLRLIRLLGPGVVLPICPLDPFPTEPTNVYAVMSDFLGRPWAPAIVEEQPAGYPEREEVPA
jgi:5'-3' exonuclease